MDNINGLIISAGLAVVVLIFALFALRSAGKLIVPLLIVALIALAGGGIWAAISASSASTAASVATTTANVNTTLALVAAPCFGGVALIAGIAVGAAGLWLYVKARQWRSAAAPLPLIVEARHAKREAAQAQLPAPTALAVTDEVEPDEGEIDVETLPLGNGWGW